MNINQPSDDESLGMAAGSTPTPTTHVPTQLHRSRSHSSHWSAAETPTHHHQGTSYFAVPHRSASPNPRQQVVRSMSASSSKHRARSNSASSSRATARAYRDNRGMLSEEDEGSDDDGEVREGHSNRGKASVTAGDGDDDEEGESEERDAEGTDREDDDPITVKDRQSLINVEHPFGLRIWKPALYKKSRSVTRHADAALHSVPSAQAERHLLPGNIFWVVCFGWWLAVTCFAVSALLSLVPMGGRRYASLAFGLGWYVAWPFGKYVEGDNEAEGDEESRTQEHGEAHGARGTSLSRNSTITPETANRNRQSSPLRVRDYARTADEATALLATVNQQACALPSKSYGAVPTGSRLGKDAHNDWLGRVVFWGAFVIIIAPLMLITCVACWALIITIPMAKLNWALIKYIFAGPTKLRFCAAPPAVVVPSPHASSSTTPPADTVVGSPPFEFAVKHPRLSEGQVAPSHSGTPTSTVLLCVYRAVGWKYYKYTIGGVNIIFVNLLPLVFFVIFDGFVLLPLVERREIGGKHVPAFLAFIASRALIFILSLASVIPLSYFIGMAVASISAQSSIGMGAVINATFGSVIEVILYAIALTQGKGHLVEGSIVGSLLAGVLLMPGMSMCAGAFRKKEQKFNAKSAGVTSMMLIMAFIGTLTPTLFYQTYGNFQLICGGCPDNTDGAPEWKCDHCYYEHPDPVDDPFYQSTVKTLMYLCAAILLFSYLIGLWFSLRTHATQIWQNPQQLLQPLELPISNRLSTYQRPGNLPTVTVNTIREPRHLRHKRSNVTSAESEGPSRCQTPVPRTADPSGPVSPSSERRPPVSPSLTRRVSYAPQVATQNFTTPLLESVDLAIKTNNLQPMHLPESMTTDDFTRAVAVATVSALRHQQNHVLSPARLRASAVVTEGEGGGGGHGGHEGPEWSRTTSAAVLLGCTALYAIIAELLVDVVDVVLKGSGIDEKFLGVTLFALVPNTTEFMNAISFALNGNIALSMEIGSAYALQVCLLQIPAMVAFSAWYAPEKMGEVANTFTLVFPRWDVVVIILSVFLMTYTYIEAKSNYHRGSILILSYIVLGSGFYFAPHVVPGREQLGVHWETPLSALSQIYSALQL
ncbi:hypothetical protein BV22DRAFT_1032822 [Leucogyrophana mollusca]|uniref:Uncharacterized protein n=1 Tax=Leucogyrophana mollusca TaxID=85980 RepID=A0ACB8BL39_9AGAM|nr:hypothetical protein BV22DRAFT_1032822 [Leucogyrophana mollusca]